MVSAILDAVVQDDKDMRDERLRAVDRSRSHTRLRVQEPSNGKFAPRPRPS
jgi:hypothetical protein